MHLTLNFFFYLKGVGTNTISPILLLYACAPDYTVTDNNLVRQPSYTVGGQLATYMDHTEL